MYSCSLSLYILTLNSVVSAGHREIQRRVRNMAREESGNLLVMGDE